MSDAAYTGADFALFEDLQRAAQAVPVTPCLIGAGAIQLGAGQGWKVRLGRRTEDWDFAVRVDSWEHYAELSTCLVAEGSGFQRALEPHRYRHRAGGTLDVVPYGGLERPEGTIRWSDGSVMDVTGMSVLDDHHEVLMLDPAGLRIASLPAIVGLKLLAYVSRRPAIQRDIVDVHSILRGVESCGSDERIAEEALERLASEEVSFSEVGAYLLGRDVGRMFSEADRETMRTLLLEAETPEDPVLTDVLRSSSSSGVRQEIVAARLIALRFGIVDH